MRERRQGSTVRYVFIPYSTVLTVIKRLGSASKTFLHARTRSMIHIVPNARKAGSNCLEPQHADHFLSQCVLLQQFRNLFYYP